MESKIVAVVTMPFFAKDTLGMKTALRELLELAIGRVIIVHDRKGSSNVHVMHVVQELEAEFSNRGAILEVLAVDEDDTTKRWLRGAQKAFETPTTESVIFFACDYDRPPTNQARKGWRATVKKSARGALILNDYGAEAGTFKAKFQSLAKPVVEALFREEAAELLKKNLRQWRTEFFALGRDVYEQVRNSGVLWTFDPTIDLIFSCLRNSDFKLEIEKIDFLDKAEQRDPQGQIWQLTRFAVMLGLNMLRLQPRESDPAKQAEVCTQLRNRLKASFDALIWAIDRTLPSVPPKDKYEDWKAKLSEIAAVTDPEILGRRLFDGRRKYHVRTLRARPFPGISVIHNIDNRAAKQIGFSDVTTQLRRELRAIGLDKKIAFVATKFVHATTFDLINKGDHEAELMKNGKRYEKVRRAVEDAAIRWLKETNLTLRAPIQIIGVGMFAPGILKLDLQFHPSVAEIFQAFRLGLHKRLGDVDGYSYARAPEWNKPLSAHLTIGYVVEAFDQDEIEAFISVLRRFNDTFEPISFELTQGEVTEFLDMDNYRPVRR